jgi:hypothetical protein
MADEGDFQAEPPRERPPPPPRPRRPRPDYDEPRQPDAVETFIPYRNPMGLTAYYLGVFAFIPCVGLLLGPAAFVTGILGLRYSKRYPEARGAGHAIAGIVCGAITSLGNWGGLIAILIGVIGSRR